MSFILFVVQLLNDMKMQRTTRMKRILSALTLYVFTYSLTFAQDFIDDNPLSPTDAAEMAVLATLD